MSAFLHPLLPLNILYSTSKTTYPSQGAKPPWTLPYDINLTKQLKNCIPKFRKSKTSATLLSAIINNSH